MIISARFIAFLPFVLFSFKLCIGQSAKGNIVINASKIDSVLRKEPLIQIDGNYFGNIYLNASDSSEQPIKVDTLCLNKICFTKQEYKFRGFFFGDFVAIDNDKPNGLIQTSVYLSYTRPLLVKRPRIVRFYLCRNIVISDIALSKIGNQIRYLPVRYNLPDSNKMFNRFDLLQYSNIIATTKINILTVEFLKENRIYFDFIPVFYNTPIIDSLTSLKSNVCTIALGGNIKFIPDAIGKFSAEMSYSVFVPKIFSNNYTDKASMQIKERPGPLLTGGLLHSEPLRTIQAIDLMIGYEPKKDQTKIFFRFMIYQNLFGNGNIPKNVFVQILLGTEISFDKFLKPSE